MGHPVQHGNNFWYILYIFFIRATFSDKNAEHGLDWRENHVREFMGGSILIIRNPYKAIISFWSWERTNSHTVFASSRSLCSAEFREFVYKSIARWDELIQDWLTLGSHILVVFYEDLLDNPIRELRRMLQHLSVPAEEHRLRCLSQHIGGIFHRSQTLDVDPYTPEHIAVVGWALDRANVTLYKMKNINMPNYEPPKINKSCPHYFV